VTIKSFLTAPEVQMSDNLRHESSGLDTIAERRTAAIGVVIPTLGVPACFRARYLKRFQPLTSRLSAGVTSGQL
jgi:hypothetical protein